MGKGGKKNQPMKVEPEKLSPPVKAGNYEGGQKKAGSAVRGKQQSAYEGGGQEKLSTPVKAGAYEGGDQKS